MYGPAENHATVHSPLRLSSSDPHARLGSGLELAYSFCGPKEVTNDTITSINPAVPMVRDRAQLARTPTGFR